MRFVLILLLCLIGASATLADDASIPPVPNDGTSIVTIEVPAVAVVVAEGRRIVNVGRKSLGLVVHVATAPLRCAKAIVEARPLRSVVVKIRERPQRGRKVVRIILPPYRGVGCCE